MNGVKRVLSVVAMACCWSFSVAATDALQNVPESVLAGLDRQITKTLADFDIPGLAIAVVADGKVIKAQGYGLRDVKKQLAANADTQFSIASTSKAFTSFLIATLVDDGKLAWDTPVKHYLPQFQLADNYASHHVNLTDMLSHRSGLPRHDMLWIGFPDLTGPQLLQKLPHLPLSKELRQKYQYNNLMFGLAGFTAEQVTGIGWSKLIEQRILNPLQMHNTSLSYPQMMASDNYAQPYAIIGHTLTQTSQKTHIDSVLRPAGGIHSSANDMSKWLLVLLNHGKYQEQQLIKSSSLAKLQLPHISVSTKLSNDKNYSPASYGLGWDIRTVGEHYQVEHGGNIDGYTASVMTYPQDGVGVVVLVNKDMSDIPYQLALDISERLLGVEPKNHVEAALQQKLKGFNRHDHHGPAPMTRPAIVLDAPFALENYTGHYTHPAYGELVISTIKGDGGAQSQLRLQLQYGELIEPFDHWHFNTFMGSGDHNASYFSGEEMAFEMSAKGDVVAVTVPFEARLNGIQFDRVDNKVEK